MLVYQRVVPLTNSVRFNNLVNFLAPDEYFIDRTGELIGVSSVVDVMIRGGKLGWEPLSSQAASGFKSQDR